MSRSRVTAVSLKLVVHEVSLIGGVVSQSQLALAIALMVLEKTLVYKLVLLFPASKAIKFVIFEFSVIGLLSVF